MTIIRFAFPLLALAILLLPTTTFARSLAVDVCVNPATDVRSDDVDGSGDFSAGDSLTVVGIIVPRGTIPTDGIGAAADCSDIADERIGTFMVDGTVVLGLPSADPLDLAYVDWHFRVDGKGSFDTTGPVKITTEPLQSYRQNVTGGSGRFKSVKGAARVKVLDGTNGFQIRVSVSNGRGRGDHHDD